MNTTREEGAPAFRIDAALRSGGRFFKDLGRREALWVALAAAASLWLHAKYRLSGFGEQDAARLAHDAIVWHLRHRILSDESTYRMHTSGGYIHLLKLALDLGLPIAKLPALMNGVGVVWGTACAGATYALFREFSPARYAGLAVGMYSLTPGFWLGNIYGMPTIPALCCFSLSLLFFVRACRVPALGSARLAVLIAASFSMSFLAITLKADIVLCTGVFVVAALSARGRRWAMFGLATFIVFGSVLGANRYTASVLTVSEGGSATEVLKDRSEHFPFKLSALLDMGNSQTIVHCVGSFMFCVLAVALAAALIGGGRRRRIALVALVWALPPILFWGLQHGNTARHSVFGVAPLFLAGAHFVFRLVDDRAARAAVLGLSILAMCYVSDTKNRGVVVPASNLLDAAERLEDSTQSFHQRSREQALTPDKKRVVLGADMVSPYLDFEIFAAAKHPQMSGSWELHDGEQLTVFAHSSSRRQQATTDREYRRQGFAILKE